MELDLNTGGATGTSSFDFNNDDKFDEKDNPNSSNTASGVQLDGIGKTAVWLDTKKPGVAVKEISLSSSIIDSINNRSPITGAGTSGTIDRLHWLQIQ